MIQPLKNKILIQKEEPKKETETGILIPEQAQGEKGPVIRGTILAIGSDVKDGLCVGQEVLFGKHDGFVIDSNFCDGYERCVVVSDKQIRCIINA